MLYLWWILSLVVGGILSGVVKGILGVKVTSSAKYGVLIYDAVSSIVSAATFYFLFSAILGHWLS